MADAQNQDILSVGTLNKDASLFFNQMENLIGSSRLQHTPSMMEMPANFMRDIRDIIRERDEEYNQYGQYNHNYDAKHDDNDVVDDDDEDYEYYEEEYEEDQDADNEEEYDIETENELISISKHKRKTPIPTSSIPICFNHSSSNHKLKGLPLKDEDSEDYIEIKQPDSTPIVNPIIYTQKTRKTTTATTTRQQQEKQKEEEKQKQEIETRRRSDGLVNISCDIFEEEAVSDSLDDDIKEIESSLSHTMDIDILLWHNIDEITGIINECNIRFEDEWKNGSKPPASEFCSLRFFFQFVYDRFHLYSQFLLDTSLPIYSEWKKMRKVRIRNASLKTVDYALKACIECVDSIKAVVRNCIILCLDDGIDTNKGREFKGSKEPKILSTTFNNGNYCIMAAWDLFDNGSTPSISDWNMALSLDVGIAQKLSECLPDLSHLQNEMKSISLAYHNGKTYKFMIISEFLNENEKYLKFDGGPIEWKTIKQRFVNKHGDKYNNQILKAFDTFSYFINPPLSKLSDLMSDKNDKYVSKRRIIAEPIMWLYYMVSFLIERQEKLQNLYITAMSFKSDNNNKGQKLNALITSLAKQTKDESERLRAIMAKLPGKDDLKQTLITLVKSRDPKNKQNYTRSLNKYNF